MLRQLTRANYWWQVLPVSCELSYWFQSGNWGGGKRQKDSQLRVAVLEKSYFLLDKSLSDNFHIAQGGFMRYLGHEGEFPLLQSDDGVKWSGCELDLVQNQYRCIHTLFSKPLSLPHLSATSMGNTKHALKCLRFLRLYEGQNYVFCKRNKNLNYAQCKRVGEYGP